MRAFIVGCGRVGAGIAERLARAGHDVTVIDISTEAFARLEPDFPGTAVRGDGTDEDVLRRAGAEGADLFYALTEGDNRNILAAQLAAESLDVGRVVAKINDPVRAEAYASLGIATICRTAMLVDALGEYAGLPTELGVRGVSEATGHPPRRRAPCGGTGRAGGLGHVRHRHRRRQGRLLPDQGAARRRPRDRAPREGSAPRSADRRRGRQHRPRPRRLRGQAPRRGRAPTGRPSWPP